MRRDEMGVDHEELEAEFRWWARYREGREVSVDKGEVAVTDDGHGSCGH